MALIDAKCPSCGGDVKINDGKEFGFCLHCGSKIQNTQYKHFEHSGSVSVEGMASLASLVKKGFTEIQACSFEKAAITFDSAMQIDCDNEWVLLGMALTSEPASFYYQKFISRHPSITDIEKKIIRLENSKHLFRIYWELDDEERIKYFIQNADDQLREDIINLYINSLEFNDTKKRNYPEEQLISDLRRYDKMPPEKTVKSICTNFLRSKVRLAFSDENSKDKLLSNANAYLQLGVTIEELTELLFYNAYKEKVLFTDEEFISKKFSPQWFSPTLLDVLLDLGLPINKTVKIGQITNDWRHSENHYTKDKVVELSELILNNYRILDYSDFYREDREKWHNHYKTVFINHGYIDKKKGFCYVATAVYGSYDCPQVWTLRRFRDNTLAETWYGRAFIKAYYYISPTIIKWFGETNWFKRLLRVRLDKMVEKLNIEGVCMLI